MRGAWIYRFNWFLQLLYVTFHFSSVKIFLQLWIKMKNFMIIPFTEILHREQHNAQQMFWNDQFRGALNSCSDKTWKIILHKSLTMVLSSRTTEQLLRKWTLSHLFHGEVSKTFQNIYFKQNLQTFQNSTL